MSVNETEMEDDNFLEDPMDLDQEDEDTKEEGEADLKSSVSNETPKRRRGRPLGAKTGKRLVVWVCAGLIDGAVLQERFHAPSGSSDDQKENFSEEEARVAFQSKYKVDPSAVLGPFYDKRTGISQVVRKKEIIPALASEYELGTRRLPTAVFHGWRGPVHDIKILDPEGFKTQYHVLPEDCCLFWPTEEVAPKGNKKSSPPPKIVLVSALETQN